MLDAVATDPRYAHTSHLLVQVGGRTVVDEHLRGPIAAPVFSVTKSLVATALGVMDERGLLPDLGSPLGAVMPELTGRAAANHSWHQVLSMTRGCRVDGPWDSDAAAMLPSGQVAHIAAAPQVTSPGTTFTYDDAGVHLLSAAATAVLGEPLADFARRSVLEPIDVDLQSWPADPDGITWGSTGVESTAADLGRVGQLWLDRGRYHGRRLISDQFFTAMTTAHSPGGPPESVPYGYLIWLPTDMYLAGGWGGQHLLVIPHADTVIVTMGDTGFRPGPPPHDNLPHNWRPALDLVRHHLLPALARQPPPGTPSAPTSTWRWRVDPADTELPPAGHNDIGNDPVLRAHAIGKIVWE